jgi:hypothetical protein
MAYIDYSLEFVCVYKGHVLEWTLTRLRPINPLHVREMIYDNDEEIKVRTGGEWIIDNLHPCGNIIVPTPTYEPFWLMLMDKSVHTIFEFFEDGEESEWTIGEVMVKRY